MQATLTLMGSTKETAIARELVNTVDMAFLKAVPASFRCLSVMSATTRNIGTFQSYLLTGNPEQLRILTFTLLLLQPSMRICLHWEDGITAEKALPHLQRSLLKEILNQPLYQILRTLQSIIIADNLMYNEADNKHQLWS
mmetsp:Transcript_8570/g.20949  ORF Transcript_8570/g.20949 Transcript_8570/m.20949 type:complete len:140 (+) Transcript_8570:5298-5717(+)